MLLENPNTPELLFAPCGPMGGDLSGIQLPLAPYFPGEGPSARDAEEVGSMGRP